MSMNDPDKKADSFDGTSSHHDSTSPSELTIWQKLNPLRPVNVKHSSPLEKGIVRKYDLRIMPILSLVYLFAYLDRTNLGNARLQGLPQDVLHGDPTGKLFDWVNSAFFFSYILVQVPATITMKKFNPRFWIGCMAMGWSVCSTLMAASFNFAGMIVCRVGLGAFEAGFSPAIPLYFSFFYTREEIGIRLAYWFAFAAVAGACGGIIAFGIQQADLIGPLHGHNWKLLFIVEGIPSFVLGIITIAFLPPRPETTRILDDGPERDFAVERMTRGTQAEVAGTINKHHITMAFTDWKVYVGGVIYFGLNAALASTSAFLPTIIKTFGFTDANAQLLTIPPYACASIFLVLILFISDRLQSRGIFCILNALIAGTGYLILTCVAENEHARYFAVFCITSGTYTHIGCILAWYVHNLGTETKKATGMPLFMAIGQCGSVLGSHLFPSTEGPRYLKGFAVNCALSYLTGVCALILTIYYRRENKRRDRVYGPVDPDAKIDTSELADETPSFRYLP